MLNIYKYPLKWTDKQNITGRLILTLDIQLQNGIPVLWVLESDAKPLQSVTIKMCPTGNNIAFEGDGWGYISTTQFNGCVWHWFGREG